MTTEHNSGFGGCGAGPHTRALRSHHNRVPLRFFQQQGCEPLSFCDQQKPHAQSGRESAVISVEGHFLACDTTDSESHEFFEPKSRNDGKKSIF
jgi:hypothetical protein